MAASTTTPFLARRLTDEEWANLDEDEEGELVDGVLVEEEVPNFAHESIVTWLIFVLTGWLQQHGGFVFGSEAKYILRRGRGRKPDLAVYRRGTKTPLGKQSATTCPPDMMLEVITSTSARDIRRDRLEKMQEYAAFNVRWYWLVDPDARMLEIYERNAEGIYVRVVGAAEGQVSEVPGFAELTLDLDALWAKVDELLEANEDSDTSGDV